MGNLDTPQAPSLGNSSDRDLIAPAGRVGHAQLSRGCTAWIWAFAFLLTLTIGLWGFLQMPSIPYNLKKIFGSNLLLGSAIFSLSLFWLGAGPTLAVHLVMRMSIAQRHSVLWLPAFLVAMGLISFLLVNAATPDIMLNKIIGAPDLYRRIVDENVWGHSWRAFLSTWPMGPTMLLERVLRYCALYTLFMIPLVWCLLVVPNHARALRRLANFLMLFPLWWLCKLIVLDWAITDNITELISANGVPILAALLIVFSIHATLATSQKWQLISLLIFAMASLSAVGITWWMFNSGIAPVVFNYGRVFSGVQFLLGENRSALLSEFALFVRWSLTYLVSVGIVATGMRMTANLLTPQHS